MVPWIVADYVNPHTIDKATPVLLLRSARHGGLAVTRSLGRMGVPVYAIDNDRRMPAFTSRYCREAFIWDIDRSPAERSIEYLGGIRRKLGCCAVLIPMADTGALFIAAYADVLGQWFTFNHQSFDLVHALYSKKRMFELAASVGISTPKTFFPTSKHEVFEFAGRVRFPIILKAIENHAHQSTTIVHDKCELLAAYDSFEQESSKSNVLLQEYIPGADDNTWMFNGYFDEQSECLFGLTGKKIRQNPPYAGIASLGVCVHNSVLADTTKRFMKAIGYQGILDIGFRYDARDGLYKVFDVNPRIGCTFRLFVSDTGMDVARAAYLNLTDQPVNPGSGLSGRKWVVEDLDAVSSFRYCRDGQLTVAEWFKSFRGLREFAFFAADDLHPLLAMVLNDIRESFHRITRLRFFRFLRRPD